MLNLPKVVVPFDVEGNDTILLLVLLLILPSFLPDVYFLTNGEKILLLNKGIMTQVKISFSSLSKRGPFLYL